jgi:hypothetical protein
MKINPTSSKEPVRGKTSDESGETKSPSQHTITHKFSTTYINTLNPKIGPKPREFGADRLNNLGKEERNLAHLASLYVKENSRSAKLDGNRCSIIC